MSAESRGEVGERCSACGEEHCLVRWFRRFPAPDDDYASPWGATSLVPRPRTSLALGSCEAAR